ncbi:MAG: heme o synthase [Methylocystis sp.]
MSDASYFDESATPKLPVAAPLDFIALLKPRVMSLVVFTALAGFLFAPTLPHPLIIFAALFAIAVGAGASGALNMWYDSDIDAIMRRTRMRPIPAGLISTDTALAFGVILSVLSVFTLGFVSNWLAATLLAFTIFFYVVIYTMWLKRLTPLNIVIGGAAGALPPIVGYAAATGEVSVASLVLFTIIFIWTPPHFWSLAILKIDEYGSVGVPMLPNVSGLRRTRLEILIYCLVLAPIGAAPWFLGFASWLYGVIAVSLGLGLLILAAQLFVAQDEATIRQAARRMFAFSILYLFALFLMLTIERVLNLIGLF